MQCALFWWKRIFTCLFSQRRRRAFHLFRGLTKMLSHLGDLFLSISATEPPAHAIEKLERVGAQFLLPLSDRFVTVFAFLLGVLVAFANQTMRGRDQIFLPARECVLVLLTAAATATRRLAAAPACTPSQTASLR